MFYVLGTDPDVGSAHYQHDM